MIKTRSVRIFLILIMTITAVFLHACGSQTANSREAAALLETSAVTPLSPTPAVFPSPTPAPTPVPVPSKQPSAVADQTLYVKAVGDIMLGRGVAIRLTEQKKDYTYLMEKITDSLKNGDVVFGNLEAPITSSTRGLTGMKQGGKWVLKSAPESFEAIRLGGFNLISLANNHILDFYEQGLQDTVDLLDKHEIAHSGAGRNLEEAKKPGLLERKGLKIGLIAYTDMADVVYKGSPNLRFRAEENRFGVSPIRYDFSVRPAAYDSRYMAEEIARLRKDVDILMVSFHWGVEESFHVLPRQVEFAHFLIDSGADVILGHHPHQFQGIEVYKGKPILYSLGNFIFDQNDPENQESFIVHMEFKDKRLTRLAAEPIRTVDKTQVVPLKGKDAESLIKRQIELSGALRTGCNLKGDLLEYTIP